MGGGGDVLIRRGQEGTRSLGALELGFHRLVTPEREVHRQRLAGSSGSASLVRAHRGKFQIHPLLYRENRVEVVPFINDSAQSHFLFYNFLSRLTFALCAESVVQTAVTRCLQFVLATVEGGRLP